MPPAAPSYGSPLPRAVIATTGMAITTTACPGELCRAVLHQITTKTVILRDGGCTTLTSCCAATQIHLVTRSKTPSA